MANDAFIKLFIRLKLAAPVDTGKITDNLFSIKSGPANFYIYKKENDYIALDSGVRVADIIRELAILEINPDNISGLFISHSDFDHVGGIAAFKNAAIYISHDEEQMITGKTARKYRLFYNKMVNKPYKLLKDNEDVQIGSIKVRAIETPGHTVGSMSYLIDDTILFVGDTFTFRKGVICPVARFINMNQSVLRQSIAKLAGLENIEIALTSHRGYTYEFNNASAVWREHDGGNI
jgi:glyoxylase-like metal-dependent hydrolase (beta-lactamase superfamily II)